MKQKNFNKYISPEINKEKFLTTFKEGRLKYEDIKQSFVRSDKLYRIDLFQFYNTKYDNTALFS